MIQVTLVIVGPRQREVGAWQILGREHEAASPRGEDHHHYCCYPLLNAATLGVSHRSSGADEPGGAG